MIDTHCHLTHPKLADDVEAVVDRAREAGLEACLCIGTGADDAARVGRLAERFPGFVHPAAGVDPFSAHAAGDAFDDEVARLAEILRAGRYLALGEIGLDYHYDLDPRPVQARRLESQLALAEELDLPVVIHVRDAHDDMTAILASHPGTRGVIHSFIGGTADADRYLDLGWYLSMNGVLTFPGADDLRAAAVTVPADRLLVETDAPYLAPVPKRGRRCEPAFVAHTLEALAGLREEPAAELDRVTSANARTLFGIP